MDKQLSLFTDGDVDIRHAPKLPTEYIGKSKKTCGYTNTNPREWTSKEEDWLLQLKNEGWSLDEIANSLDRSITSIQVKLKRISKKTYSYNKHHIDEKYQTNMEYFCYIEPKSILDIYSGIRSYWEEYTDGVDVVTNDVNSQSLAYYHERAEMLIHKLYYEGYKFDVVDLDPFGSAYECFDLAIKMANKGIIITYGEMGHKRFKRLDYVRRYYGINSLDEFTIERLISETQKIALRNKKVLIPTNICNWNRISRVYYEVQDIKITEQWNTNK